MKDDRKRLITQPGKSRNLEVGEQNTATNMDDCQLHIFFYFCRAKSLHK